MDHEYVHLFHLPYILYKWDELTETVVIFHGDWYKITKTPTYIAAHLKFLLAGIVVAGHIRIAVHI